MKSGGFETNVEHTRGKIAELFGMETYDDNKQLEEQLSKGIVNTQTDSDGNITNIPMKLTDNLVTWFKESCKDYQKELIKMNTS